MKDSQKKVNVP